MYSGITPISGMQATDFATYGGGRSQTQASAPLSTSATSMAAAQMGPNPSLRIDNALAMVVIEFRGSNGTVENSIPTAQQLNAYRRSQGAERSGAGEQPAAAQPPVSSQAADGEQSTSEARPGSGKPIVV